MYQNEISLLSTPTVKVLRQPLLAGSNPQPADADVVDADNLPNVQREWEVLLQHGHFRVMVAGDGNDVRPGGLACIDDSAEKLPGIRHHVAGKRVASMDFRQVTGHEEEIRPVHPDEDRRHQGQALEFAFWRHPIGDALRDELEMQIPRPDPTTPPCVIIPHLPGRWPSLRVGVGAIPRLLLNTETGRRTEAPPTLTRPSLLPVSADPSER